MILLKHPTVCAASAAATLLGAIVLAGPLFAASGDFSQAAATKSPAAREGGAGTGRNCSGRGAYHGPAQKAQNHGRSEATMGQPHPGDARQRAGDGGPAEATGRKREVAERSRRRQILWISDRSA